MCVWHFTLRGSGFPHCQGTSVYTREMQGLRTAILARYPLALLCVDLDLEISTDTLLYILKREKSVILTRESLRVVDALPRPWLGYFGGQHRQPSGGRRGLLLETTQESVLDVVQAEGADGRAHKAVHASGEDGIKAGVIAGDLVDRFCKGKGRLHLANIHHSHAHHAATRRPFLPTKPIYYYVKNV